MDSFRNPPPCDNQDVSSIPPPPPFLIMELRTAQVPTCGLLVMLGKGTQLQLMQMDMFSAKPDGYPLAVRYQTLGTNKSDTRRMKDFSGYCRRRLGPNTIILKRRRHRLWRGLVKTILRIRGLKKKLRL